MTVESAIYRSDPELFDHAEAFREYSKGLINSGVLPSIAGDVDMLVVFFVLRAHTTYCAALRLLRSGFAIDAVMLLRNLVEGLITFRFILDPNHPEKASRYIRYDAVIRKKGLSRVDQLGEAFTELRAKFEEKRIEIEAAYEEFREEFTDDFLSRFWAGTQYPNLERLAAKTDSEEFYSASYASYSQIVHGTVETSRYYVEPRNGEDPVFKVGPSLTRVSENLKALLSVFPLYWDEVSIRTGSPPWDELREHAASRWFEHFSRRDDAAQE